MVDTIRHLICKYIVVVYKYIYESKIAFVRSEYNLPAKFERNLVNFRSKTSLLS